MHELVENSLDEAFVYRDDILLIGKRHLKVDLRELRLTVGAQILVAEAARYLKIAVKSRIHEKLLIKLRRLRKSVELSVVEAARDKIVSRALGRGLYKAGSLDIDKAVLRKIVACYVGYHAALDDILLHIGTAEIEISVRQTKLALYVAVLNDRKRRGLCGGKHLEGIYRDLDLSRGKVRIDRAFTAAAHRSARCYNVFRAHAECGIEDFLGAGIVEGKLNDSGAVAKIYEDQASEIALTLSPAEHRDPFSDIRRTQLERVMSSLVLFGKACMHKSHRAFSKASFLLQISFAYQCG